MKGLCKYRDVFSKDDRDLSRTSKVLHHMWTGHTKPIKQDPRGLSIHQCKELERQILNLLDRGFVLKGQIVLWFLLQLPLRNLMVL